MLNHMAKIYIVPFVLFSIMKSIELNFDGEGVSFLTNGGLNVSKLIIFNSRTTSGRMKWHRVSIFSLCDK